MLKRWEIYFLIDVIFKGHNSEIGIIEFSIYLFVLILKYFYITDLLEELIKTTIVLSRKTAHCFILNTIFRNSQTLRAQIKAVLN